MESTTDTSLRSWVEVRPDSDFPIQNLPYGVFKRKHNDHTPSVGVAIGDYVLDLAALHSHGFFAVCPTLKDRNMFASPSLNAFMALGRRAWSEARTRIALLLNSLTSELRDNQEVRLKVLILISEVDMQLPVEIGDFTDFYVSKHHATNCGSMFRSPENALNPNWLHMPVAYHGRAGTVFLSGTDIIRPCGQSKGDDAETPTFGPSRLLDFELEVGFFMGRSTSHGETLSTDEAEDSIFGLVLLNDWSARDIQKWEYVPLGPFLGKSFATSISPWVVTMDALEPFRVAGPTQEPKPLPYLRTRKPSGFDIHLEAHLQSASMKEPARVTSTNFNNLYWTMSQMLAHHVCNGTAMRTGDLLGTGTISGPTPDSLACMLELTWKGTKPLSLLDGTQRKFLQDEDCIIFRGWCQGEGYRIGFGECRGRILPARV